MIDTYSTTQCDTNCSGEHAVWNICLRTAVSLADTIELDHSGSIDLFSS